jgi:hypothetical protein
MKNQKNIIIFALSLILVGGIAFYGGMQYEKSTNGGLRQSGFNRPAGGMAMNPGMRQGSQGGGFVNGTIKEKSGDNLVVTTGRDGSKIVLFSGSTKILKSIDGSVEDIAVGTPVMIMGSQNQDGSITAQSIQIRSEENGRMIPGGREQKTGE